MPTLVTPARTPILSVRNLVVELAGNPPVRVIDGVSFDVFPNEVFGIVGESGSGKSLTMLAVLKLLPEGRCRIVEGEVTLAGRDLGAMHERDLRAVRGKDLAIIFQDPMTSFNPVIRVGPQIAEMIRLHQPKLSRAAIKDRVIELLTLVGVPNAAERCRQYPMQLSGGTRQRAMIAMAIANDPMLLIADEPTTALDVTIQAQVMEVLAEVRVRTGAAMILITHDLGLVAERADRIAVMYGGRIVEQATVGEIFATPRHPYTAGLFASLPRMTGGDERLFSIPGQPPEVHSRPSGCVFHPRCGMSAGREACRTAVPELRPSAADALAACHYSSETPAWAELAKGVATVPPAVGPTARVEALP